MVSFSNKKFKRNLKESDSSEDETEARFLRFIISKSDSAPITNSSPFIIEKVVSTSTVKKFLKWNSAYQGGLEEPRKFSTKITKFHKISVKTYPHKSLNVSKGVIRSK